MHAAPGQDHRYENKLIHDVASIGIKSIDSKVKNEKQERREWQEWEREREVELR